MYSELKSHTFKTLKKDNIKDPHKQLKEAE